jgi:hypothetical protein
MILTFYVGWIMNYYQVSHMDAPALLVPMMLLASPCRGVQGMDSIERTDCEKSGTRPIFPMALLNEWTCAGRITFSLFQGFPQVVISGGCAQVVSIHERILGTSEFPVIAAMHA